MNKVAKGGIKHSGKYGKTSDETTPKVKTAAKPKKMGKKK